MVLNRSRGGLFVQTSAAAIPGEAVHLDLDIEGGRQIGLDARVIWRLMILPAVMTVRAAPSAKVATRLTIEPIEPVVVGTNFDITVHLTNLAGERIGAVANEVLLLFIDGVQYGESEPMQKVQQFSPYGMIFLSALTRLRLFTRDHLISCLPLQRQR